MGLTGGAIIAAATGAEIASAISVDIVTGAPPQQGDTTSKAAKQAPRYWRPPQWNKPAVYMITVQGNVGTSDTSNLGPVQGTITTKSLATTMYVFDAVVRASHNLQLQITEHPVQTGANISDHAYMLPFRVTLEIGISDAMAQFGGKANDWTGTTSKSVSAFQTLMSLQANRVFLTLSTRLYTYSNMMIESIAPEETNATIASLRATVTFKQVFTATVATQSVSARPNTTDNTQLATQQAVPPPAAVQQQYSVTPPATPQIPGSGFWTSVANALGLGGNIIP